MKSKKYYARTDYLTFYAPSI